MTNNYGYPIPPGGVWFSREDWEELAKDGLPPGYGWPTKGEGCDRFWKIPGKLPADADGVTWHDYKE